MGSPYLTSRLFLALVALLITPTALGQHIYWVPQVVDGEEVDRPGEYFATRFTILNRSPIAATVKIHLFSDDGQPFSRLHPPIGAPGGGTATTATLSISPGGSAAIGTTNGPGVMIGWANITSDKPVEVVTTLLYLKTPGVPLTAASILDSPLVSRFHFPAMAGECGTSTGLALLNPSSEETAVVTIRLFNSQGDASGQRELSMAPSSKIAQFLNEGQLFTGLDCFSGTAEVSSSIPLSAVVIRVDGTYWSTFPVFPD